MAEFIPMKDLAGYLSKEQMDDLINACDNPRDKLLLMFLLMTGRRVSEIVRNLKPKDVRWKDSMIEFTILKKHPRKRNEDGTMPEKEPPKRGLKSVDPMLLDELKNYITMASIGDDNYIFPITRQRVHQIIRKLGEKTGINKVGNKPIHIHQLRHSFAIEAAKKAENPRDIVLLQEMLDHTDIKTTMFYLQFNPIEQRELLSRMWKK